MKRGLKKLIGYEGNLEKFDNEMMNLDFYTSFNEDLQDYIDCENIVFTAKRNLEEKYLVSFEIIELNKELQFTTIKITNIENF